MKKHTFNRGAVTLACASALAVSVAAAPTGAKAQPAEEFFKGKTINIAIGFSAGGGYDFFARLVARHMGKHIPGNPTIIAQNMPGAGSLRAANWLYAVAPKDGTALGSVSQSLAIEEALGNTAVNYKSAEFNFIGRVTSNVEVHVIWHLSKGTTIEGAKSGPIPVASTGPGSPSESFPKLMNALLGTQFQVVRGYTGSTAGLVAMERGEVDGALTSWNTMKTTRMHFLKDNRMTILVQYVQERHPEISDVPTVVELGQNEDDRRLLAFAASSGDVGRYVVAPPGVPEDRVALLRKAFDAMIADPDLKAELKKANIDIDPASGAQLQKIIEDTASTPPALIERMTKILAAE